jgi:dienelactone hydrolase
MASVARQADVATESITCENGMPAFLAYPSGGGKSPTIILMHERYGLVKHTRDQAMRCARDGFAVLAPNFFFKHPDQRKLNAGDARYDITDPESVSCLKAAIGTLKKFRSADLKRLAVAGYCQTGRHPLVFAAEVAISAAVVWYGAASKREWEVNDIQPKALDQVIAAITSSRSTTCENSATASSATARATTSTSTRARRMAGSTTRCQAVIARRKRRPAGQRNSAS